jgi:hypothetical protein
MNRERELILVEALANGYEIEEEPKYLVLLGDNKYLSRTGKISNISDDLKPMMKLNCSMTEQEIKKHDERYWPFRKPVEEVEE